MDCTIINATVKTIDGSYNLEYPCWKWKTQPILRFRKRIQESITMNLSSSQVDQINSPEHIGK